MRGLRRTDLFVAAQVESLSLLMKWSYLCRALSMEDDWSTLPAMCSLILLSRSNTKSTKIDWNAVHREPLLDRRRCGRACKWETNIDRSRSKWGIERLTSRKRRAVERSHSSHCSARRWSNCLARPIDTSPRWYFSHCFAIEVHKWSQSPRESSVQKRCSIDWRCPTDRLGEDDETANPCQKPLAIRFGRNSITISSVERLICQSNVIRRLNWSIICQRSEHGSTGGRNRAQAFPLERWRTRGRQIRLINFISSMRWERIHTFHNKRRGIYDKILKRMLFNILVPFTFHLFSFSPFSSLLFSLSLPFSAFVRSRRLNNEHFFIQFTLLQRCN